VRNVKREASALLRITFARDLWFYAASCRQILMEQNSERSRKDSLSSKLRSKKIDRLVFEWSGCKQRNRQTKVLKIGVPVRC
jgi:hypothetical protein